MSRGNFLEAAPLKLEKKGCEIRMNDRRTKENICFTGSGQEIRTNLLSGSSAMNLKKF